VLAVQINVVSLQALEAGFACFFHVVWLARDLHLAIGNPNPEFGYKKNFIPASGLLEPSADELLVGEWPIPIAGDLEIDAHVGCLGENFE
jgi:hypothetical protein